MEPTYDVTTFIKRFLVLEDTDPQLTDAGNMQPALYDPSFACENSVVSTLPVNFYLAANEAFAKLDMDRVAFPSNMFDREDICVMDKELFEGLLSGSIVDDEAYLPIENVVGNKALQIIRQALLDKRTEPAHG